jgi:hypothetical protein
MCVCVHVCAHMCVYERERERERSRPFHSWTGRALIHLLQCQDVPAGKMAQHLSTMSTTYKNEGLC